MDEYVNLVSYFVCECPDCGAKFPAQYNSEFLDLLEEINEKDRNTHFMSHKGCKYVPATWHKVMSTKHFVLYKEN